MRGKRSQSHEDRKEEIIRASAVLFEQVGYHGASMQMVADAVNLGKPTLYHYFRSKTDILFAIHETLIHDLFERHRARVAAEAPHDVLLVGICTDILRQIDEHPGYVRAFFEHHDELGAEQQKEMRKQRQNYFDIVCEVLNAGTRAGMFVRSDPRLTALTFLGMCNYAYKWFPQEKERDIDKTARAMCKLFLDGLRKQ